MTAEVLAIDVLIEPDAVLADLARALNARLRVDHPQGHALDATHVPHVSLLHRYVRRSGTAALCAAVAAVVSRPDLQPSRLRATGYTVAEWAGQINVSIEVQRTPLLLRLQQEIEGAVAPFAVPRGDATAFVRSPGPPDIDQSTIDYVANFVPERMGEAWSPHVTIGSASAWMGEQLRGERFEPLEFAIARFAVYQLGNRGTARLRLWPP